MSDEIPVEGERMLDIGLGWLVRYKGDRVWLDFEVWEVESRSLSGDDARLSEEPKMKGYVKWDGCMNLDTDSRVMRHFCGPEDMREFADVLDALYPLFAEVMPGDPEYFTPLAPRTTLKRSPDR